MDKATDSGKMFDRTILFTVVAWHCMHCVVVQMIYIIVQASIRYCGRQFKEEKKLKKHVIMQAFIVQIIVQV